MTDDTYPTQRTRFWLEFFYPNALVLNAGIMLAVAVFAIKAPVGYRWAALAAAVLLLAGALVKARKFKRRYSL